MNGCRLSGDLCLPILSYTLVVSKKCEITGGVFVKQNLIEIVFIPDRSGSMSGMEASKYSIDADMAVEYHCDRRGTAVSYDAICGAVSAVRACGAVPMGWKNEIEKDRKSRRRER